MQFFGAASKNTVSDLLFYGRGIHNEPLIFILCAMSLLGCLEDPAKQAIEQQDPDAETWADDDTGG